MLEKIAVNLMAGVPAVVKPSEFTSYLTELMVREIVDSKDTPRGFASIDYRTRKRNP